MIFYDANKYLYSVKKLSLTYTDGINIKTDTASGFIVGTGSFGTLVSARHVLDPSYNINFKNPNPGSAWYLEKIEILEHSMDGKKHQTLTFSESLRTRILVSQDSDIGLLPLNFPTQQTNAVKSITAYFTLENIADKTYYEGLLVGDIIHMPTFSLAGDALNLVPLFNSGFIASDPNVDYSYDELNRGQLLAVQVQVWGGASGAPIFSRPVGLENVQGARPGRLIGIHSGHTTAVKNVHSGISFCTKSTSLLSLLKTHNLI